MPSSTCSSFPVPTSQNLHNHLAKSFMVLLTEERGRTSTHVPSGHRSQVETHIQASGSTSGHECVLSHTAKQGTVERGRSHPVPWGRILDRPVLDSELQSLL